jgi:hypothetical protein
MSKTGSGRVWRSLRSERPKLAKHFLGVMQEKHPELYAQLIQANADDKFRMMHLRKKWGPETKFAEDISTDSYCCSSSTSSSSDSQAGDSDGDGDSSSDTDSSKSDANKSIRGPPNAQKTTE